MSMIATLQPAHDMARETNKGSPGFFSVLLGRGTTNAKTEAGPSANVQQASGSRVPRSSQQASAAQRSQPQGRTMYAPVPSASSGPAPRSSMAKDRRYGSKVDAAPARLSGLAAFEAALHTHANDNSKAYSRSGAYAQTRPVSIRSPHTEHFFDAMETQRDPGEMRRDSRHSRKVSFQSPASSVRKGKPGLAALAANDSSQDSFFNPTIASARPAPKASKSKHTRSSSKVMDDERFRPVSTTAKQVQEEPKPQHSKYRRAKESVYPLAADPRRESFQAVRASGPDRVIIVPTPLEELDANVVAQPPFLSSPPPMLTRRPGPSPLAPSASAAKRSSMDVNRSHRRSFDVERTRSTRERRSPPTEEPLYANKEASRSRSRVDKVASRTSTSTRPHLDDMEAALRQQPSDRSRTRDRTSTTPAARQKAKVLRNDVGTTPKSRERYSEYRVKPSRAQG